MFYLVSRLKKLGNLLKMSHQWRKGDITTRDGAIAHHPFTISSCHDDLYTLWRYLLWKGGICAAPDRKFGESRAREFHQNAARHIPHRDKLWHRPDFMNLPDADRSHLDGDIIRYSTRPITGIRGGSTYNGRPLDVRYILPKIPFWF
jgi:hypothetical protein